MTGAARTTVRAMREADLERVAAIEVELFGMSAWTPGMLREELRGPGRWYVVAARSPTGTDLRGGTDLVGDDGLAGLAGAAGASGPDDVVGYTGLWFDGDVAQVMTLGVVASGQQRGTGSQLLTALLGRARELGAPAVLLEVAVDNGPAIALYERFGFERIGLRKRYYQPEDTDAHVMRLELARP